jgi:6-pyruvoyltetrahydropterin/6-carboxytetrahydropterin synthase
MKNEIEMYYVTKTLEISSAHALTLSYESKCEELHGHNWEIKVHCKAKRLNADGMVTDFTKIKEKIEGTLDHKNLNRIFDFNPTAENIAKWICDNVENCYKVEVWESRNNLAVYEKDED